MRLWRFMICAGGALGLAVIVGCQSGATHRTPTALPPLPPGGNPPRLAPVEIENARALYLNKCARCHKFHDPARYRDGDWNRWMTQMSRKAKLLPEQEQQLREFLGLYRATPPAVP